MQPLTATAPTPASPTTSPVLSPQDRVHFEERGYIHLSAAFPPEAALQMQTHMWQRMHDLHGIAGDDRTTWSHPDPQARLNATSEHPVYQPIASTRLCSAINELLGPGRWQVPRSWGGFLISFPPLHPQPWYLPRTGWHWDTDPAAHQEGLGALFVFTLYSTVVAQGGGTLALAGSPRAIDRHYTRLTPERRQWRPGRALQAFLHSHPYLAELGGREGPWLERTPGDDHADRIARFMQNESEVDGVPLRVIEMTGEPGDAYLCHPSILHAASPNRAAAPRFMRSKVIVRQLND